MFRVGSHSSVARLKSGNLADFLLNGCVCWMENNIIYYIFNGLRAVYTAGTMLGNSANGAQADIKLHQ